MVNKHEDLQPPAISDKSDHSEVLHDLSFQANSSSSFETRQICFDKADTGSKHLPDVLLSDRANSNDHTIILADNTITTGGSKHSARSTADTALLESGTNIAGEAGVQRKDGISNKEYAEVKQQEALLHGGISAEQKLNDGTTVTQMNDGTAMYRRQNGDTTVMQKDGTTVSIDHGGVRYARGKDETSVVINSDGSGSYLYKDGTSQPIHPAEKTGAKGENADSWISTTDGSRIALEKCAVQAAVESGNAADIGKVLHDLPPGDRQRVIDEMNKTSEHVTYDLDKNGNLIIGSKSGPELVLITRDGSARTVRQTGPHEYEDESDRKGGGPAMELMAISNLAQQETTSWSHAGHPIVQDALTTFKPQSNDKGAFMVAENDASVDEWRQQLELDEYVRQTMDKVEEHLRDSTGFPPIMRS